jgi:hypothetical protein
MTSTTKQKRPATATVASTDSSLLKFVPSCNIEDDSDDDLDFLSPPTFSSSASNNSKVNHGPNPETNATDGPKSDGQPSTGAAETVASKSKKDDPKAIEEQGTKSPDQTLVGSKSTTLQNTYLLFSPLFLVQLKELLRDCVSTSFVEYPIPK